MSPAWSGTNSSNNAWHQSAFITGWSSSSGTYAPPGANGTAASARFHSYDASSGTSGDFITPVIDLSANAAGTLQLDFFHINTSGTDVLRVYVSDNGGSTWSAALAPSPIGVSGAWTLKSVPLPGNSAATKIKFTATSDYGITDIGIDEIKVFVPVPADAPPVSFTATDISATGMTIGWTDNSTNETSFRVYRSTDNITFTQQSTDIASTSTATTGTAYSQVQAGLLPGTAYYYRIAAVYESESSCLSGAQATNQLTPANAPPVSFTLTAVSNTGMTVGWTDNSTNETSFRVYRSTDSITFTKQGTDIASTSTATSGTAYLQVQAGLLPGTIYYYRIAAVYESESPYLTGSQATNGIGNIISSGSGNWSSTIPDSPWPGGVVPNYADNVTIADGSTVNIDITAPTCRDLTVGQGASGILTFTSAASSTLTVNGSITVAEGGNFNAGSTATIVHRIYIGGNSATSDNPGSLTVNGTFDMWATATTGRANVTFFGIQNSVISGTGTLDFNSGNILYKGATPAAPAITPPILEIQRSFTVMGTTSGAFLSYHSAGTLKISGTFTQTNPVYSSVSYSIPAKGGIWLNNANFTIAGQAGYPTVNGLFRVTAGTFNIGTTATYEIGSGPNSVYFIEGGAVNVAGRFNLTSNGVYYNQSGGTISVATIGNTLSANASFGITSATGTSFIMSGGTIVLVQRSTGATIRDYYVAATPVITGGTLQLGTAATVVNFNFRLYGNAPSVVIDNTNGNKKAEVYQPAGWLSIKGNLTVKTGTTFDCLGYTADVSGDVINNGTIQGLVAGSRFDFKGTAAQSYSGSGTFGTAAAPFAGFGVGVWNPNSVTLNAPIVTTRVNLTTGSFINSNQITLGNGGASGAYVQRGGSSSNPAGSFDVTPNFNAGTAGVTISYASANAVTTSGIEIPASRAISGLVISSAQGAVLNDGALGTDALTMTLGTLTTTEANMLTVTGTAAASVVYTAGFVSGPLARTLPAGLAAGSVYLFPVGKSAYRPLELLDPLTGAGGTAVVRAEVFDANCGGTPGLNMISLNTDRYWHASVTTGNANFTGTAVRLTEAGLTYASGIGTSATPNGNYDLVSTTPATATAIVSDALTNPGYFAIGIRNVMTFVSGTATQTGTSAILQNSKNQSIIGIEMLTIREALPLTVSRFTVNGNGTTATGDIRNAKIWSTGTSSIFDTTTQFGSTVVSPSIANFNIQGSHVLTPGTNYFWLTFDVPLTATSTHTVDAECTNVTVSGVDHTPTVTAPAGFRSITLEPPTALTATAISFQEIALAWIKNAVGQDVMIATNSTETFGTPVNGTAYVAGDPLPSAGTILYNGPLAGFSHTLLISGTSYYYKAWSVDAASYYSATGPAANSATPCDPPISLAAVRDTSTTANLIWTEAGNATAWEYVYGLSPLAPPAGAGTATSSSSVNPVTGLTPNSAYQYYVRAMCTPSFPSSWSGPFSFYTGYCTPALVSVNNLGITNVTFSTINNTPPVLPVPGNYGDFSAMSGNVEQGATIPVMITFETGVPFRTKIWIDWNDDFDFREPGETVYSGTSAGASPTTLVASFIVPPAVSLGNHRMRIGSVDGFWGAIATPCCAGVWGSYQDYTVNVIPQTILSGTVTGTAGEPITGATVSFGTHTTTSQANGSYIFNNLLAGTYTVSCSKTGYQTSIATGVVIAANAINIHDFILNHLLYPPVNLQGVVQNQNDAHLTWMAPVADQWIKWDNGIAYTVIGTGSVSNFDVASRWPASDIAPYAGKYLKKIRIFPNSASCTYTIKVWKGANAATLLYSQVVVAPAIGAFNEITLATPVLIDGTDEFWFGYNVNSTGGYPAGCDAGPQVAGMGNMIYWGGAWKELTALNAALTYNWNIAGYVSLDPVQGNQPLLPMAQVTPLASMKIADTPGAGTFDDSTLQPGQLVNAIFPSACKLNEVSPGDDSHVSGGNTGGEGDTPLFALMGYNVYRNSIKINGSSLVSGVQYNDPGLSSGTYDYAVTAVYDEGESAPSLPATITICNYTPITGTTPATRCGIGTAVLGATCTGGIIKWYTAATGGTAVGNGPSFTTPVISSTTSYYVSTLAEGNYGNVGPSYIAYGNFSQAGAAGIMISTTLPGITINSADIPFSGTGTMTIALKDVTNTTVISSVTTGTITGAGNTSAVTVPLGLQIAMPGNYLLILNSATGTIGNLGWSIGTYPYTAMSGAFGITGGYWYGTSTWLMALYNLSVSMCESSRTQVTATVTPPPALAVTAGLTICNNTAVALSVTSIIPDYDTYTWSPAAGLFEDAACQVPYVTGANFETLYFRSPVAGLHTYTCTANNLTTMCANIAATTVTNLPANPVVTATRASICTGGTSVLTTIPATGYGTATFQWQGSTDNNTFADITAATSIGYTTPVLTGTSFYKLLIKTGGNTCTESNVATVTVNDPQVLSVTPATRCGIGSVTLGATASTGSNLHWYTAATGGFPVGAGSLYTTPPVSSTTSYYVNATGGSGSENVGPSYSGEWNYWQGGSYGIMITTTLPNIVINSADIPFTGTGKLTIALKNEANTTVISSVTTGTITGAGTTSVTVPLGLQVAAPGNYLLIVNSFTGTIGALGFSLCTYPFTALSGAFSITNGYNVEPSPYYNMFFYNLVVTGECGSPRTQVTATVTPPPALAVTPDPTTCNNTATALSVTSAIPDYDTYTWSPEAGLFEDAACQTPYVPGSNFTTVYFKSAVAGPHAFTCSAGNLATGCANIATTMVTNLPANPFVSANPAALCSSGISELTTVPASGYGTATFQWQSSSDNIAFTDVIAATSIGYTTPLLTGTTYYKLLVKTGGNVCTESYVATVNVYNAHVLTITPATRCGTGIVNLEATAGPGENLHWYTAAAGGPPVGYGSPFSTPPISLTTTFYVCASLGETSGHAGPVYIYNANDWSSTVGSPGIMITTTLPDIVINSVDIPFAGTGTLTIALKDLTNTSVISSVTTGTVTGAGTTSVTVPLGLHVVTPGSYLLIVNSVSGTINMLGYSYCTYPFTALSGAFNITSGYWWGACSINAYLYNLAVSYACESPRTPVTATVLPAPMPMAAFASLNRVCDAATPFNLSSSPTCISPTQEGGFEQGNTFALNNWTAANGTSNTWTVGTAAGVQEGSHAAYAGTNFVGTGNAGVNHFYRDITIPPGATNITLKFYLKMPVIDDGYDFFEVYTAQTTYTPVVNTNPYDNNVHHLLWFTNTSTAYNTYTLLTVPLSDTLAGTTRRYIFTYRCDAEAPYAVPAVDNISVTADFPEPPTYLWTSAPAGFVSTLQNPTGITQGATTRYTVTAQNSYGCAVTAGTTVFSFSGASVITQPAAATTCAGQTAVFTVVTEDPGLSYQWRKNLVDISVAGNASASTATLSLPNVTQADAAVYDVVVTAACGSSLTSSSAALTVKPTPMASATSNSPVCEGGQISLAGSSDIGISYNWTGPNGFTSSGQFPTISAAPLAAGGTYLCTASLNGCSSAAATVGVTVKPMPGAVTITPAAPVLACGAIQEMTATGGTVNSTLLNENFNGQVPGWTAANNSSGGTPANAAWNFIPEGYYTNIHSNDNSGYVMSNSDAQGNGSTTSTQLMTPVMNTVGYTSLTLSFWHNFEVYTPADVAKIEVSTDGGTTWGSSALAAYTANEGTSTSWVHKILDLSAYVNQPALQIRFNYYAVYGYYWAIDNVSITGLQSATYTWSPLTDLYADAGAASAYTGTQTPVVWAKPSASATYTVTATSPAGCPNTAGVLVTVSPASLPVSVTVSPSSNPVCAGTEVTYTATPANGGTVPEYQWQKGGITISGATNATYSYIPGNNDAITCSVTSNAACVIGNPATSGVVTMTVSPLIAANFGANKLTPQKNEIVQFTDMTAGSPTSWDWSFDRPTFAFVYGTSASSQNPQVIFTDGGPYTVTLLVSNSACSGSEIKPAFLRAGIPGLWTGNSSGAWNTATNWEDWLVPGSSTDVVIPASAVTNWPVFTGDLIIGIHCGSLTLDGTDSKLTVTGNLTIQ